MSWRRAAPTRGSSSPTTANSSTRCLRAWSRSSPAVRRTTPSRWSKASCDVAGAEQEVGGAGLRGDVVGRGLGGRQRVRPRLVGAAEQLHLTQRQRCLGVVGLGVEDRLVRGLGGLQVTALQGGLGGVQARVLRLVRAPRRRPPGARPGRGLHQLVDELAGLLLGDRAGELGDQLPLPDGLDRGDALHPQALRERAGWRRRRPWPAPRRRRPRRPAAPAPATAACTGRTTRPRGRARRAPGRSGRAPRTGRSPP